MGLLDKLASLLERLVEGLEDLFPSIFKGRSPYPFTKTLKCGTVAIHIARNELNVQDGAIVFEFKKPATPTCDCTEFGWIQHWAQQGTDAWHYDNGVRGGTINPRKTGSKSDPTKSYQPTQPPAGTAPSDWDDNPWYGSPSFPNPPGDFDRHPTPQEKIGDKPDSAETKYKTQLVCATTGEVLLTWKWGPAVTGQESPNQLIGKPVRPPP